MQFTFDAAFAKGGTLFKSRYGGLLGATMVFLLVLVGVALVQAIVNRGIGLEPSRSGQTWTDNVVTIFFTNPFAAGLLLITLLHLRDESPSMSTLFAGFKRYWPLVGLGVLVTLIFVAPILIAAIFLGFTAIMTGDSSAAMPAITVTAIVAGLVVFCLIIFLATRLFFTSLLCIDPRTRLGVGASIATSWRMTGPVFWPLLGLIIVMGLILIGTTIVLVLPLFFVGIPLCLAITAAAYELISSEHDSGSEIESANINELPTAS